MKAAAAAVALLAAGCTHASAGDGPTVGEAFGDIPNNYATVCVPLQGSTRIISGQLSMRNESDSTVTITGASVSDPNGVQVTDARIGPVLNGDLVGIHRGRVDRASRAAMRLSKAAVGAQVAPGEKVQLILVLRVDPAGGTAAHERVLYTDADGAEHVYDGSIDFTFPARRCTDSQ